MNNSERDKILEKDIKELLIAMHEGASLINTLKDIMSILKGVRYVEDEKFLYLLDGMVQIPLDGKVTSDKERGFLDGWTESANEINFSIKLAKDLIKSSEDK